MEDGIQGYFDLIQLKRYANLKGVTEHEEYCRLIKRDGYATDSKYVDTLMAVIRENNLTQYDTIFTSSGKKEETEIPFIEEKYGPSADDLIAVAKAWLGYSEANGKHREIIDLYNSHTPRARGYAVSYGDAWCATFVSACAIKAGMTDIIPLECGCEEQVKLFQKLGCWEEDGTVVPEPGWIVYYNWDQGYQPNNGFSDHVGIVVSVDGGLIKIMEGNNNDRVGYRSIPVGWGYIRGYGKPKYGTKTAQRPAANTPVKTSGSRTLSKEEQWVGKVTASALNVRSWAGTNYANIQSYPLLKKGNLVSVCDTVYDGNGNAWYYVKIAGKYYGFVSAEFVERA